MICLILFSMIYIFQKVFFILHDNQGVGKVVRKYFNKDVFIILNYTDLSLKYVAMYEQFFKFLIISCEALLLAANFV